jgi:predicted extracellular nuclease
VTADFQSRRGGFFMQEPGCDGDATTSDGTS